MHRTDRTWMGRTGARAAVVALAALALALALVARAPARAAAAERASMRPGVVLVGFRPGVAPARRRAIVAAFGRRRGTAGSATVLRVRRGRVRATVRALRRRREVRYAEPDYAMRLAATPDDPAFPQQWAPPMDHTTAAWDVSTGTRSVVIGEADSGVEYTHPDLAANIWSNPGNVGGCPAGTHGYNVIAATCDPMDDETFYNGHGTHVAGILGAIGNNGMGVAGVNWSTTILPVKWTTSGGGGSTSDLITALEWFIQAKQAGVNLRVVNDSAVFVGTPYSQALSDEIDKLGANDILFVTAAGNTGDDNDDPAKRRYPCGYDRPTEICVAATDDSDRLPTWANYGVHTVDLAAPGGHIFSTLRNGSYGYVSGSSMASPQVAGTAALMLSRASMTATQLKAALLASVDRLPVLDGLVRTGGRLNVCRALPGCSAPANPPAPTTFGTTTIGSATDTFGADRKRVSPATLTEAGRVTKLRLFVEPGGASGQETLRGLVYADAGGAPGRLLGTTGVLAYDDGDTSFRGWWDLSLPTPLSLPAGRYWLGILSGGTSDVAGFRWESTAASGRLHSDIYADGASDPFGAPASTDAERMSLYAIYTPSPANTSSPPPTTTVPSSPPDTAPS